MVGASLFVTMYYFQPCRLAKSNMPKQNFCQFANVISDGSYLRMRISRWMAKMSWSTETSRRSPAFPYTRCLALSSFPTQGYLRRLWATAQNRVKLLLLVSMCYFHSCHLAHPNIPKQNSCPYDNVDTRKAPAIMPEPFPSQITIPHCSLGRNMFLFQLPAGGSDLRPSVFSVQPGRRIFRCLGNWQRLPRR